MTTLPASFANQLKTILSQIKDSIEHTTTTTTTNTSNNEYLCHALFQLECAQRGVILVMDHHNTTTTNNKLLDTLHSIAGKPLLDDASFPNNKPLRAALSVLQGRVAEALLLSITTTTTTDSTLLLSLDPSALQSVMKRCRDVHDTRLECFLQLLLLLLPEPHNNNNNNHKKKKKKKLLRSLAEGCYYRATEATPDAPPLWKKLVDLHYLEYTDTTTSSSSSNSNSNSNWRVVVPLEQLQRIARSKQNHKRVQEVAVTLAECVLEQEAGVVGSSSSDDDDDDDWTKTFLKVFVVPYRPVQPYDPIVATSKAREYLQTVGEDEDDNKEDNNSTIQPLRLALVWLRMELMEEDARLQQLAEEEYLKAKNRSSISVNVTKKDCFRETRAKYLAESMVASIQTSSNNNNDDDKYVPTSMHVRALTLRDLLLNRNKEPSETDDSGRWQQACAVLTLYLQRQQDSIQAAANVKANKPKTLSSLSSNNPNIMRQLWMQLRDFVWPLLKTLETRTTEQDDNRSVWTIDSLSSEQLALTQQVIYTIIFSEWMLSADVMMKEYHTTSGYCTLDQLRLCRDVLKILMEREKEASKQQQQVNVIGGTATQYDVSLQSAYRSATAWVYLYSQASSDRNAQQSRIVSQAVSQTETVSEMHGSIFEYGAAYLEFLVGWSGLHKEPWSFCITPEARTLVAKARVCLEKAGQQWGRPVSWLERVMLDVGWADAHVGSMSLLDEASALYRKSIEVITAKLDNHEDADVHAVILARLLQCKCVYGECLLQLFGDDGAEDLQRLESDLKLSLGVLQDMDTDATTGSLLSFWRDQGATLSAIRFLLASGRQLVADALLRRGLSAHQQARDFLEQAVRDSPADPTALFSFGAFHLRMALFGKEEVSEDWTKLAQALLLRAAKADATKASPFALLGCWYERAGDMARAVGCYSKAIALDASHPVAGRGLLRLRPADALLQVLEKATSETSSRSGWAWRSLGEAKAEVNGDDDLAIVSLVTALRCRDIVCPQSDSLSCFYVDPRQNCESMRNEFVTVSAELAACYRRVGRYTASIRCYESAIEAAGEAVSSSLLCSCAQVELELGLLDEASAKFLLSLQDKESSCHTTAAYGLGLSLLSMAKRDIQDGKAGAAIQSLQRGIDNCVALDDQAVCILKLIGDLYSCGAALPSDVFISGQVDDMQAKSAQLAFINTGVAFYRKAFGAVGGFLFSEDINEHSAKGALLTDIGSNLLAQGQLLSHSQGKGLGLKSSGADELFQQAEHEYLSALQLDPELGAAWCGLGCALRNCDPLLSQHSFCRSLELDSMSADAYANLAFLYTAYNAEDASEQVCDAITKIADTPFMWINRALLAERSAGLDKSSHADVLVQQAADANRAALQVAATAAAKEGLAMTCRLNQDSVQGGTEMNHLLTEYLELVGRDNLPAVIFQSLSAMEIGMEECEKVDVGKSIEKVSQLKAEHGDDNETLKSMDLEAVSLSLSGEKVFEADTGDDESKVDLPRRIFYEPGRGDLWLALAKELLLQQADPSQTQLLCAQRALHKARQILADGARMSVTTANNLSDALALEYWVDHLAGQDSVEKSAIDVQKSLLLNPGNTLARELLLR